MTTQTTKLEDNDMLDIVNQIINEFPLKIPLKK